MAHSTFTGVGIDGKRSQQQALRPVLAGSWLDRTADFIGLSDAV